MKSLSIFVTNDNGAPIGYPKEVLAGISVTTPAQDGAEPSTDFLDTPDKVLTHFGTGNWFTVSLLERAFTGRHERQYRASLVETRSRPITSAERMAVLSQYGPAAAERMGQVYEWKETNTEREYTALIPICVTSWDFALSPDGELVHKDSDGAIPIPVSEDSVLDLPLRVGNVVQELVYSAAFPPRDAVTQIILDQIGKVAASKDDPIFTSDPTPVAEEQPVTA